jgi:GAF domain-containing protein
MSYKEAYLKLAHFGRELMERVSSLEKGLPMISAYAKDVVGADRCSIFVYSPKTRMLWTTLADGMEKIRIDADSGIAGRTLESRESQIVNDPYQDPAFLNTIDKYSGYVTQNIASVPVFDSNRKIIGVLQLLNKEGGFDATDTRFMTFFAHYISSYLELATLFKEDQDYLARADK